MNAQPGTMDTLREHLPINYFDDVETHEIGEWTVALVYGTTRITHRRIEL